MPDTYRTSVIFGRNYIRDKIQHLDFVEARRLKGPIYEVLVKELYEAGCTYAARELSCLAKVEAFLYGNSTIKRRLCNDFTLLYTLVENAKIAEISFQDVDCDGYAKSMRLLEKNLEVLEPLRGAYDWLLRRLYEITFQIGRSVQGKFDGTDKVLAGIYYKFACYLSAKVIDWDQAILVLNKAVPMVRGKNWQIRLESTKETQTLHEAVCRKLGELLMDLSKHIVMKQTARAIQLAQHSLKAVAEVGMSTNRVLICRGYLTLGIAFYEDCQLMRALKELKKIKLHDKSNPCCKDERKELAKVRCRMHIYTGACYLNLEEDSQVPQHLYAALSIAQQYQLIRCEGETQLHLGKMYSKRLPENALIAKESYEAAKEIFLDLGDLNNTKKTTYLLAKLKADELFSKLLDLMRTSKSKPCDMHKLRQWKNRCKPFWLSEGQHTETAIDSGGGVDDDDPLYCLIREEESEPDPDDLEKRKLYLINAIAAVPSYLKVIKLLKGR